MASENETPMWIDLKPKCRASCPRIKSANGPPFHILFDVNLRRRIFFFFFFWCYSFLYLIFADCLATASIASMASENVEDRLDWISSGMAS